jgi:LAO/AO transport system kinase
VSARRELTLEELVAGVAAGDPRALARAISLVEDGDPLGDAVVRALYPSTGRALVVGLTGPPGAGKSTLTAALVSHLRERGSTVGVVAVDPSSAFTHGALLGDRIRLADHFVDPGVFIRSMGTRGHLGGLAEASLQAALLLDASGKDVVVVETVGTGQTEIEIARVADVVVLALMPGAGDSVQALKAGIMEIPDVIAVTKADVDGAAELVAELRGVVALDPDPGRRPVVLATSAAAGEGIAALWETVVERRDALAADGRLATRRRAAALAEVVALASGRFRRRLEALVGDDAAMLEMLQRVERRELDPVSAADLLLARLVREGDGHASDAR